MASHWEEPKGGRTVGLQIANSITNTQSEFIPANGNQVTWYICGPTVYDHSHMGHARNYVSFDILRRIVNDYFQYNVFFVMNITDIDDKIIIKAHQRQLARIYEAVQTNPAFQDYSQSNEGKETLKEAAALLNDKSITKLSELAKRLLTEATEKASGSLPEELTKEFDIQEEYLNIAKFYEADFLNDMDQLNVRRADALTRVSEYVPEIIKFIEGIIDKGFAYESSGDVYFNLEAFISNGFSYNKTSPATLSEKDLSDLLKEGEGSLVAENLKKNPRDFALWKSSKPGEPKWNSPWGEGRPGWHIECSAMASDLLGSNVDINCGGVDLKFPHHDNQLAQSEAHFGCKQWVNYFLHSGHLHISGMKMSKSLKNFITIDECLQTYTANQLRFLFLMHRFNAPLEIDLAVSEVIVQSALLGSQDITESLKTISGKKHSISFTSGTDLYELSGLSKPDPNLKEKFVITFSLGDETLTREWEVIGGLLNDEISLGGTTIRQMDEAISVERNFTDFLLNCKTILRLQAQTKKDQSVIAQKWNQEDRKVHEQFSLAQQTLHEAFLDNFNTPKAVETLQQLVRATNSYIKEVGLDVKQGLLLSIVKYLTKILTIFGASDERFDSFGFQWEGADSNRTEARLGVILDDFCSRRDRIRSAARQKASSEEIRALCEHSYKSESGESRAESEVTKRLIEFLKNISENAENTQAVLQICDRVRDDDMPRLGIRFEDDSYVKGTSVWKLDTVRATLNDREKRKMDSIRSLAKKEALRLKKEEELRKREALKAIPKEEFFKAHPTWAGQFATFDETGFPLTTQDGKPLSKGLLKKAQVALKKHTAGK